MVRISAFSALRYNTKKVSLKKVVCPPYDVINAKQRKGYLKESDYNVVRLVLPENKNGGRDYKKAQEALYNWIEKGILKTDDVPAIYIYLQEYKVGKKNIKRYGLLSLLKLENKKKSEVLPHEKIFSKPFLDRVNLMKAAKAHLSPLFIVFRDKNGAVSKLILNATKEKPKADIFFEDVRHKLWKVTEKNIIEKIVKRVNRSKTFIADGHHRFAASMATKDYFDSLGVKKAGIDGYDSTLVYFVSSYDKGLLILPTYRAVRELPKGFNEEYILKKLEKYFKINHIACANVDRFLQKAAKEKDCSFVIFYANKYIALTLKDKNIIKALGPKKSSYTWKSLDVSILHNLLLKKLGIKENTLTFTNIYYYKGKDELINKIKAGKQKLGVLLNAPGMGDVEKIAEAGEKMPHKSTYFFPKPLTGLVIHKF